MKPAGQPEQASVNHLPKSPHKSAHAQMLAHKFLSNVNDTRVLSGPCSLVTSP